MEIIISLETNASQKLKKQREHKGKSLIEIPNDYIVLDLETTGLDPRYDEIIEIGALKVRNNEVVDSFQTLVKTKEFWYEIDDETFYDFSDIPNNINVETLKKFYIDDFIINLTGITNEMLENAPTINLVLDRLIKFIGNDIILGHNINFDINFLYDVFEENSSIYFSNDFIDLMRLARKLYPEFENHKLKTISNKLNISNDIEHRALSDCYITNECFLKIKQYIYENNIDIKELFKYIRPSSNLKNIISEKENFDESHLFYNKYFVFTGKLEKMERKEAAKKVVNLGGFCENGITKKTNFLILGNNDYCSTIKDGKSSKQKKAEQNILNGQDLQILSEDVFYEILEN